MSSADDLFVSDIGIKVIAAWECHHARQLGERFDGFFRAGAVVDSAIQRLEITAFDQAVESTQPGGLAAAQVVDDADDGVRGGWTQTAV